ncbi:DNA polymerase III subunit delta' [Periweissella cryptocerci]|uniref:DNA polymerase III subunit delta n=1 Tax=Periweissella cryptocerci TaxID=2506420 RepID=A0A4P6YUU5_9LACO|nr:DNA polymerase III subunit delta' [Periweissella cryptocerci]QBO36569.1 DNA polymerase III subunit delta' [Periweissella cryptocerci]
MNAHTIIENAEQRQPVVVQHFQKAIENQQLAHAYLFNGPSGAGRSDVASWLAMRLFCQNLVDGQPCGECYECTRIANHEHPDVISMAAIISRTKNEVKGDFQADENGQIIENEKDLAKREKNAQSAKSQTIKIDDIRPLVHEFAKSGTESSQRVFIIERAEMMTNSAANSILKFIEEPIGNMIIILLTENRSLILPTIISRTQVVEFRPLAPTVLAKQLIANGMDVADATLAVRLSNSLTGGQALMENDWLQKARETVWRWFNVLMKKDYAAFAMIQTGIIPLAPTRDDKDKQAILLDVMLYVFRDLLLVHQGVQPTFVEQEGQLQQIASQFSEAQLIALTEAALATKPVIAMNVSFQNVAEMLTLQVLDILS